MNNSKKFWQSKTFWVNVLSAVGIVVQTKTGFVVDPATQALGLTLINGTLRAVTKEPVSFN
jgi:hypothetical protein